MKTSKKNEDNVKVAISKFIIQELVEKMNLQYDKKDILDYEISDFEEEEITPKGGIEDDMTRKETYKCILTYKSLLS